MAKVATAGPFPPSNAFQIGGGSKATVANKKRKTPSEFRGELLKRKNVTELVDESPYHVNDSARTADSMVQIHKTDLSKCPRYVDTRLNDLFPVRKNGIKLRPLSHKEISKESNPAEHTGPVKAVASHPASGSLHEHLSGDGFVPSKVFGKSRMIQGCNAAASESSFRSVSELSLGGECFSSLSNIDMDKALKGLVRHEPLTASKSLGDPFERISNMKTQSYLSEFGNSGRSTPLDLTLKTTMRVLSASSVSWFHRLVTSSTFSHNFQSIQNMNSSSKPASSTLESSHMALYSWQYPQSSLPTSVISALTIAEGDGQTGFLSSRQEAWEDSFRSLYYMFRKKNCSIFYVCTTQFVVMFTAFDGPKEAKRCCSAYISQSTRGLRSLLKEHDACFSMPSFHLKAEEEVAAGRADVTENEKHNSCLDQFFTDISDIDNSPQSLLMFAGNERVHALYDVLLNYRFFLTSLTGMDVPILYSPVPFKNAALSAPEVVRCKDVRRADHIHLPEQEYYRTGEADGGSSPGMCYSVEIKGAYLPPWTIGSICDAIGSNRTEFEASFVTEPSSIGLNIGLDVICQDSNPEKGSDAVQTKNQVFGMQNFTYSPHLRTAYLKSLKCTGDSYTASISRL